MYIMNKIIIINYWKKKKIFKIFQILKYKSNLISNYPYFQEQL